jgi:membrane protease YdiL (CAAX protease family)
VSGSTVALLAASALVAYLALVLPVTGRSRYRALRETTELDPGRRMAAYRSSIVRQWLMVLLCLGVLLAAGAPLDEIGLGLRVEHLDELVPGLVLLVVLGGGLALLLRLWPAARARVLGPVAALLPRTARERRMFVAVALTAGIAEEIVFRGFLLVYLTEVFPPTTLAAAMVVSSLLFGLAHTYQGLLGVLLTGLAGYWLAGLFVLTGSLVLPALVHALVDLRLLLVLPRDRTG